MDNKTNRYYEFGEFRLDARRRVLFKNGTQTALSTRICDLLLMMIQHEGQVLEHDEILDKVWEGTFVEQSNLKKSISTLRQILGEQPNESLYIKTIPRRGYSFVAPVRVIVDEDPGSNSNISSSSGEAFYLQQTDTEIIIEEEEIFEDDELTPETGEKRVFASEPQTVSRHKNIRLVLFLAGIAVVLIAAILTFRFFYQKPPTSFSAENVQILKLTSEGKVFVGDVSTDGNYILYNTRDKDGLASLWMRQSAADSATRIVPPVNGAFYSYVFTRDGNYIYYTLNNFTDPTQSGIYKVPTLGGTPVRVLDKGLIKDFTLDGKKMIFLRDIDDIQSAIFVADLNGDNERPIAAFDRYYRIWDLKPSPDKTNLLISLRRQYQDKVTFRVAEIPINSTPENFVMHDVIPEQERAIRNAVWLPDKSSLLLSIRETNAEIVQLWQYFPSSNVWRRITNDNNNYGGIYLFNDGKAFVTGQKIDLTSIWVSDNPTDEPQQVGNRSGNYLKARWMNDGRILFNNIENQQETLSVMAADGSAVQKLTLGNDGVRLYPVITGNGKYISFTSSRSGTMQVWRMDMEGKNVTQMTHTDEQLYSGQVLSDGQTVIYSAFIKPIGWILLKQTPDGKTIHLTEKEVDIVDISPDEKTFATFIRDEKTGKYVLSLCSMENGTIIRTFELVTHGTVELRFTPDGKGLAYISTKNEVGNVFVQPLDGSPAKQVTNFRSETINYFDWSPDGKKLLTIRGNSLSDALEIKSESDKSSK